MDPWGAVLAQCKEGTDLATAEVDLTYLAQIRQDMPVWKHRRHDLYSQVIPLQCVTGTNMSLREREIALPTH